MYVPFDAFRVKQVKFAQRYVTTVYSNSLVKINEKYISRLKVILRGNCCLGVQWDKIKRGNSYRTPDSATDCVILTSRSFSGETSLPKHGDHLRIKGLLKIVLTRYARGQ